MATDHKGMEIHLRFLEYQASEKCLKYSNLSDQEKVIIELEAMIRAGIPAKFAQREFDGFYAAIEPHLKEISTPPLESGVMLSGGTGTGKTTLLANMARRLFRMWALRFTGPAYQLPSEFAQKVLFLTFSDYREMIRGVIENPLAAGAEGIELFQSIDLFILDDMLDGDPKPYDYLRLYDVINFRYNATPSLPVWISTNISGDDLKIIPEFKRSYDRLTDKSVCRYFELHGKSRRT